MICDCIERIEYVMINENAGDTTVKPDEIASVFRAIRERETLTVRRRTFCRKAVTEKAN